MQARKMSETDRLKYRRHFFTDHAVKYADSLYKTLPILFGQESTPFNLNKIYLSEYNEKQMGNTCKTESISSNVLSLMRFVEWIKSSTEDDFLIFCFILVECGEYSLFSALLKHHAVEYTKLQQTYKLLDWPKRQRIKNWTEALKQNSKCSLECKGTMLETQRIFLQTHKETLKMLITDLNDILEYLLHSKVLSYEQILITKCCENEKKVAQLIDFITNADATDDCYHRLCHALLLTNQFTLFCILHDLCDIKRLELFFDEYDQLALENDENQLNGVHLQTNNANNPQLVEMEDDIEMPSGILENLNVDLPDTSSASQLVYYSTPTLQQDVYRNFSKPKGLALIINNYKFQQHNSFIRNRDGTEVDKKNISNLLAQLGYQVLPALVDLTATEMLQAAFDFAADPRHAQADSCVMVVLTHGEYDYFTGVDGNKVNLHRFLSSMNSRNAPKLAGKPKIFIMQACRGETHDNGIERYVPIDRPDALFNLHTKKQSECHTRFFQNDQKCSLVDHSSFSLFSCIGLKSTGPSSTIPPPTLISSPFPLPNSSPSTSRQSSTSYIRQGQSYNEQSPAKETVKASFPKEVEPDPKLYKVVKEPSDADMLIAYATTPNYVSWRNSMNGTWFVQSICEVFSKHAANEDIVTMLTRVNKQVAQVYESSSSRAKQIPEMASRLRKKFYFFPGIDAE